MTQYFTDQKRKEEEKKEYEFPEYTKQELWELNNLLKEKYNDGNGIDDITQWLKDEGALNKDGDVIITGHHQVYYPKGSYWFPHHDYPTKYELLQDKLEKANKLLGRKEFAQKKEVEALDKLAEEMTTHADI